MYVGNVLNVTPLKLIFFRRAYKNYIQIQSRKKLQ